jgi:hypothetical protein
MQLLFIYSKFHVSESGRFRQPYMVSAHFLYLGKVEFMEEGTLPPAYTFPSYTTYIPPHNPVITGTLINDVLASLSPFPKPEFTPPAPIPAPAPTVLPVKPTSCRKVGHPKIDSTQAAVHTIFELLAHIMLDKRVCQHGGKTKNEKQETIKKGPIEVSVEIGWSLFLDEVAELVQMTAVNLITDTFEWRWLKPANGAWLPLVSECGFNSMIKQVCVKPDAYVILCMQPPRPDSVQALVGWFFLWRTQITHYYFSLGLYLAGPQPLQPRSSLRTNMRRSQVTRNEQNLMMMWKKSSHHSLRNIHQAIVLHTLISLAFITGQVICILISTIPVVLCGL